VTGIPDKIETPLTRMLGVRYPILVAPMFLVSNVDMIVAAGEAGAIACVPSLNYRTTDELRAALAEIRARTPAPFGVNLIIKGPRVVEDLTACLEARVPLIISSLGDPTMVVQAARAVGTRVFCDVINLKHAKKAQVAGADALIAVGYGAGGHAGRISPMVLVPWLRREIGLPVVAAGGIAGGEGVAAALALGADLAYVGTRMIASTESPAPEEHKQMILRAGPEDVEYTSEITGTYGAFLTESLASRRGASAGKAWKEVFSAGQTAGLVHEIKPIRDIVHELVAGYVDARGRLGETS
jgi:nitronate monooxygenase